MHFRRPPRKRPEPEPLARQPAALEMLAAAEFADKEWGTVGEFLAPPANDQPTPAPQEFIIPPPDWEAERLEAEQREREQREQERLDRLVDGDQEHYPAKPGGAA